MRSLFTLLLFFTAIKSIGQTNPDNVPKPPIGKLKIYEPFFGKFRMTSEYGGLRFNGTIEVKPVIKGWYVEQTIHLKSQGGNIDREFRMMVTYDTVQQNYRVWRFETLPPIAIETELRTQGADIILEMQVPALKEGEQPAIIYNRYSMLSKDTMKIVSELHSLDGKVLEAIGISTATRIK